MHASQERREVEALRSAARPRHGLPPEILASWDRCAEAGLAFGRAPEPAVVEAAELRHRRDAAGLVRRLAIAEIETLQRQIAGSNFLLAFGDRDGVILDLHADERFCSGAGGEAAILCGSRWTEALCGTNGLGTALAIGAPVAVNGPEHYLLKFHDICCAAAPIRDASGEVVGVLDASSQFESRQRHTQALVRMAATHIENVLLVRQTRGLLVLALHPRAEFLGTLDAGLVAFDDDGHLAAANARARAMLAGLDTSAGARFEQIFAARFDRVQARLARGGELRLVDALGSAIVATRVAVAAPAPRPVVAGAAAVTPDVPARPPAPACDFVAEDPAVREAVGWVEAAVRRATPVLIVGETGTGKEMLARHAHRASGRRGPFVAVNCAALPAELFEAELFGYAGGAYTGARREGGAGLIVSAHGGTLLLDEIGDLPLPMQAALLRFLDDRTVRPVGGTQNRTVDVQLLAATNGDLAEAVARHRFRADLLFRLDTVRATMPPLRLRSDFAAVARHVLAAVDPAASIEPQALARLAVHPFPGNIRELRSLLTRALLRPGGSGGRVREADLAALLPAAAPGEAPSLLQRQADDAVQRAFEQCGRSVAATARHLGISRTTVYKHLRASGHLAAQAGESAVRPVLLSALPEG